MIGVDPGPYQLGELVEMARGVWSTWSALMAVVAEPNRDPKLRAEPFTPADFDPFAIAENERAAKPRRGFDLTPAMVGRLADQFDKQKRARQAERLFLED